ncbi:MAG: glycosyltransferase family 2 protein [Candidatus Omnitrophica bacterium]|nr:glycosyltransferase family 2 protein [Candidatus Omnitrophota bacterium]
MPPRVSVIIPTYNRSEFLERAIKSVIQQTFRNFEIIVVENGNPNRDAKVIVNRFLNSDVVVRHFYETKPSHVQARNIGVCHATGEYIAFLDDDDEWTPTKLAEQVKFMESHPEVGLIACNLTFFDREGHRIDDPHPYYAGEIQLRDLVAKGCLINSLSAVMVKRDCFEKVGMFDKSFSISNDYEFYVRTSMEFKIWSLDERFVRYKFHESNASRNVVQKCEENIKVLKRLHRLDLKAYGVSSELLENTIGNRSKVFHGLAVDAMDRKEYRLATELFTVAFLKDPLIGLKISWGRFQNPLYRLFRPYGAFVYCIGRFTEHFIVGDY